MPNIETLYQEHKLTVAIDGWSSCGKSTLAKALAKRMNYIYVDSGAMYRAVAQYCIMYDIDVANKPHELLPHLDQITIYFKLENDSNCIYLNGFSVDREIRTSEVSSIVSEVAAISEVRAKLVALQKSYGKEGGIVMDGRDIGTVVFPEAEFKFFVTAEENIRAERRLKELKARGAEVTFDEVVSNLRHRDHIDSTREDSPLTQSDDAIVIDTSHLNRNEQVELAIQHISKGFS